MRFAKVRALGKKYRINERFFWFCESSMQRTSTGAPVIDGATKTN
jgi:hypothetical protein